MTYPTTCPVPQRTALYRHFDAAGRLLYVGISLSAVQRLAQHKQASHWFAQIARVDVEWLPSRHDALRAESKAIANEAPLHNRARPCIHTPPPARPASLPDWGLVVLHPASGRRDGNYFDHDDARDQLAWWRQHYPDEQFELVKACGPARPELRPQNANEWRRAA